MIVGLSRSTGGRFVNGFGAIAIAQSARSSSTSPTTTSRWCGRSAASTTHSASSTAWVRRLDRRLVDRPAGRLLHAGRPGSPWSAAAPAQVAGVHRTLGDPLLRIMTFVLLKLVGLVIPLRMSEADMEMGDIAVHGHEVYPSTSITRIPLRSPGGSLSRRGRRRARSVGADQGGEHSDSSCASRPLIARTRTIRFVDHCDTQIERNQMPKNHRLLRRNRQRSRRARLGRLLREAGASIALAYVRHAQEVESGRERLAENEAESAPRVRRRLLGNADVPRFVVLSGSTRKTAHAGAGRGRRRDRLRLRVPDCSRSRRPQASARRLLDGGPVALALPGWLRR